MRSDHRASAHRVSGRHSLEHKGPRLAVGARRDQIAIFGIEQEHEPEQNSQQAFIEMLRPARCQSLDALPIGGMQTTKQLVQRAQDLRGEPRRHLRLGVAAGL